MRQKRMSVHDLADGCGMSRTTLQWRLSRPSTWQMPTGAVPAPRHGGSGDVVSSWSMALWTRRTLEHYHPDDGPLDAWLASWAARGMVPEYPWDPPTVVVNGRTVWPYALTLTRSGWPNTRAG